MTLQELSRSIAVHLKPTAENPAYQEYEALKNFVVEAAVDTFNVQCDGPLALVEFCLDVDAPIATHERVLMPLASAPQGTTVIQHVSKVVVPFLSQLQQSLVRRSLDLRSGAFRHFLTAVVGLFAESMTPKPPGFVPVERLRAVGCVECEACRDVREFLLDSRPTIEFKKRIKIRKHIAAEADSAGGIGSLGFTLTTAKDSRPHILTVRHRFGLFQICSHVGAR